MAERGVPPAQLRLQWVYGYRGHQSRNNVVVTSSSAVVYFVAAVGIVHTTGPKPAQTFYGQHTDDILRSEAYSIFTIIFSCILLLKLFWSRSGA